jgi:hypothetical protein
MRRAAGLFLLALTPVWAQIAKPAALTAPAVTPKPAPRLSGSTLGELEKTFDSRLATLAGPNADPNEFVELMGDTRGLQLLDYGLVFTADVSLVKTPSINPFQKEIPKSVQDRVHQRRVERLPLLKEAMKEMLHNMAAAGAQLPATQQLVLSVRLYYGTWENTAGMPAEVLMRATRANAAAGTVETEER